MEANHTLNATASSGNQTSATPGTKRTSEQEIQIELARFVVYICVIAVAFLGNGLLVLTISCTKTLRTTTNYFLLNMAIGDLLVAVVCAPFQLASWKFPSIKTFDQRICKSMPFVQLTTIGISIYTMTLIAIDRYRAVMYPLKTRLTHRAHIIAMAGAWAAAALTAAPMLFVYEVRTLNLPSGDVTYCGEFGWKNYERDAAAYTYALFILQYAVPGIFVAFIYIRIFLKLWYRNFPGMGTMSQSSWQTFRRKHYRRKKTFIMLMAVFFTFLVCNLPMQVISLIHYVQGSSFKAPSYMGIITMSAEMLMYTNSALNPILYAFLHQKFIASTKGLVRKIFCRETRPSYNNLHVQGRRRDKKISSGTNTFSVSSVKRADRSPQVAGRSTQVADRSPQVVDTQL